MGEGDAVCVCGGEGGSLESDHSGPTGLCWILVGAKFIDLSPELGEIH